MTSINAIFSIFTIIVGGVCIMLFVSTKTLRDSRDDQEKRIRFLEDERSRDKELIASLETAVTFWRSAATGDEKLVEISQSLDALRADSNTQWVQVAAGLGHLGRTLDNVDDSVTTLVHTLGGDGE